MTHEAEIGYIPFESIAAFGGAVEGLIARAAQHNYGEATVGDILASLAARASFLIGAVQDGRLKALAVLRCVHYPRKKALSIEYAAGGRATDLLYPFVEQAARELSCDRVECICRESAARLSERFGFDTERRVCILDLTGLD
jgi:hypothetical protein